MKYVADRLREKVSEGGQRDSGLLTRVRDTLTTPVALRLPGPREMLGSALGLSSALLLFGADGGLLGTTLPVLAGSSLSGHAGRRADERAKALRSAAP